MTAIPTPRAARVRRPVDLAQPPPTGALSVYAQTGADVGRVPVFLRGLCRSMDWSVGIFWRLDADHFRGRLCFAAGWTAADMGAQRFVGACHQRRFALHEDAPGQAWATARPMFEHHDREDPLRPRASLAFLCALRMAVTFPVLTGERVLGVVECLGRRFHEPDEALVRRLATSSMELGRYV